MATKGLFMNMMDAVIIRGYCLSQRWTRSILKMDHTIGTTPDAGTSSGSTPSPFDYLHEKNIYQESSSSKGNLIPQASSIYELIMVIGMIGLACSIAFGCFKLIAIKNGQTREETKSGISFKMALAVLLFMSLFLLGIYHNFLYEFL